MSETMKKVFKWVLCIITFLAAVGFLTHFVLAIYRACVADDVITAQNRIGSAYQFIYMICSGLIMAGAAIGQGFIKVKILPEKIRKIFFKSQKED